MSCERGIPFYSSASSAYCLPLCSKPSKCRSPPPPRSSRISGGFFDVPSIDKRLGELESLTGASKFWDNNEQARKVLDEQSTLRKRSEPLFEAEKKLEDLKVMVELCESEPEAAQLKHEMQLDADGTAFLKSIEEIELGVLLNGPHDRRNCILSINAGAGGTEACDWANMLLRMYGRWCESRGWKV